MKRRTLLRRTAALAAAGSVAGCLAGGPGGQDDRTTTTRTTKTTDSTTTTPDRPEEPFETVQVGSRDGVLDPENNRPHEVAVTNAADERRTIRVRVRRGDEQVVDSAWEFPAYGRVRIELLTPGSYGVVVAVDGEMAGKVDVERSYFDCNDSVTNVTVTADGRVEAETISTAVACGPSVREASVRVTDGRCWSDGSTESASMTFGDGAVDVTGTFRVPSPDHGLELSGVEWTEVDGRRTFVVTVSTTEPDGEGGGMQCVGALDYEASVTFDDGLPGRVAVRHGTGKDARMVATATRESTTADGG